VATPSSITWGAAPAVLPPGAKAAVIEGDPGQAGAFTLRLWLPDGYTIPPHFHPVAEHVTVIQGTFMVGMGDQLDASKFAQLPSGTFGLIPPGMKHFARAKGEVVIQLHGTGPWGLIYVNPADDPRGRPTP
jgi:quercetin dioxygenase-like cupin family protein